MCASKLDKTHQAYSATQPHILSNQQDAVVLSRPPHSSLFTLHTMHNSLPYQLSGYDMCVSAQASRTTMTQVPEHPEVFLSGLLAARRAMCVVVARQAEDRGGAL
jgi:hypothetical protein